MSRFNPRLIAIFLIGFVGYTAFHLVRSNTERWREFTASDDTKITAFALLESTDSYIYTKGKGQKWFDAQPKFDGQVVLDQSPVQDAQMRGELQRVLARITPSEIRADCIPEYRHALRFEKGGRTVNALISFGCQQIGITDNAGKNEHIYFNLPYEQGRDKFDAIFARLGMKQWKPDEKQ